MKSPLPLPALALLWASVFLWSQGQAIGQEIDWRPDFDSALAESQATHRPVLLHFTAEWCRPCQDLKSFVLGNREVVAVTNQKTIPVLVNINAHPGLAKQYNVDDLPTQVFVDSTGRLLSRRSYSSGSPFSPSNWIDMVQQAAAAHDTVLSKGSASLEKLTELQQQWEASRVKPADAPEEFQFAPWHMQQDFQQRAASDASNLQPGTAAAVAPHMLLPGEQPGSPGPVTRQPESNKAFQSEASPAGAVVTLETSADQYTKQQVAPQQSASTAPSGNPPATVATPAAIVKNPFMMPGTTLETPSGVQAPVASLTPATAVGLNPMAAQATPQAATENRIATVAPLTCDNNSCGLDGFCPVTLLRSSQWKRGQEAIGCTHRGRTYHFADFAAREQFMADPDRWSPLLAGFDPVAFADNGRLTPGKREFGVFMSSDNGQPQVVLFDSQESQGSFKRDPDRFMEAINSAVRTADGNAKIQR